MNNLDQLEKIAKQSSTQAEEVDKVDRQKELKFQLSPVLLPINNQKNPFKIGIAGGHSAGKAMLTDILAKQLQKNGFIVKVVKQENFEIDEEELEIQDLQLNQKQPQLFHSPEWNNFIVYFVFKQTKANEALDQNFDACQVVIIEGTLIFCDESLRNKLSIKLFLDADQDVRLSRKIYKEVCIKKKDVNKVVVHYLSKLKPLFENYINPSKRYADFLIPNYGGSFDIYTSSKDGFETYEHAFVDLLVGMVKNGLKTIPEESI